MQLEPFEEAPDSVDRLQITIRTNDLDKAQWAQVKALLDDLRRQGVRLDARTFEGKFPIE